MDMNKRGLYNKYAISRNDGQPVDPSGVYFVLKISKDDPAATHALVEYAKAILSTKPELAKDINMMLASQIFLDQEDGARHTNSDGTLEMAYCTVCGDTHWVRVVSEAEDGSKVTYKCYRKMLTWSRFIAPAFRRRV